MRRLGATTCTRAGSRVAVGAPLMEFTKCPQMYPIGECDVGIDGSIFWLFACRHNEQEGSFCLGAVPKDGDLLRVYQPLAAHS